MNKKGQTGGLITSLVFGVASLVIGVIIAYVIVSTLTGAGLIANDFDTANTVTNETGPDATLGLNRTTYTLATFGDANTNPASFLITNIYNESEGEGILLNSSQYSLSTVTGAIQNATNTEYANITISYTYNVVSTVTKDSVGNLSSNFTAGVNEVSKKIPTVLLIAAIILILGVLAILVGVWQRMRMGGGADL